jgi:hypothetical protein
MSRRANMETRSEDDTFGGAISDAEVVVGEQPVEVSGDFADDLAWAQPRATSGQRLRYLAGGLGVALVGTLTFAWGAKVGKDNAKTDPFALLADLFGGGGPPGGGGDSPFGGSGGGTPTATAPPETRGTVTQVGTNSIVVRQKDGTTMTVLTGSGTLIGRRASINTDELVVGDAVAVEGADNGAGAVGAGRITVGDLLPPPTTLVGTRSTAATTSPNLGGLLSSG